VGLGYLRLGTAEKLTKFKTESLWRDYRKPGAGAEEPLSVAGLGRDYLEPQLFTTALAPLPARPDDLAAAVTPAADVAVAPDDEHGALERPKVGKVIIDQLRRIDFEPYRLWRPPLDAPRPVDDVVEMYLGRPWDAPYAANPNLVVPVGIIDRPYKHDQQPAAGRRRRGGDGGLGRDRGRGPVHVTSALPLQRDQRRGRPPQRRGLASGGRGGCRFPCR